MKTRTRCPSCGATFAVAQEYVGRKVKCAKCHVPFVISPAPVVQEDLTAPSAADTSADPAPSRRRRRLLLLAVALGAVAGAAGLVSYLVLRSTGEPGQGKRNPVVISVAKPLDIIDLGKGRTAKALYELKGHHCWVCCVAISPDSAYLASGDMSGTVRVWDSVAGRTLHTLNGHRGTVWCIEFSPREGPLVSAGDDATLRFWDVKEGNEIQVIRSMQGGVRSMSYTPDGSLVASGGTDGSIALWNVGSRSLARRWEAHSAEVNGVAFSRDGQHLLSGGADGTLRMWDFRKGTKIREFKDKHRRLCGVAFSPDGRHALSVGWGDMRAWDVQAGTTVREFSCKTSGRTVCLLRGGAQSGCHHNTRHHGGAALPLRRVWTLRRRHALGSRIVELCRQAGGTSGLGERDRVLP